MARKFETVEAVISLSRLLDAIPASAPLEISREAVRGLNSDSRLIRPGHVFVALRGETTDGHVYVKDAFARGCLAAVVEDEVELPGEFPLIRVNDSHRAYGEMAARYYGNPAKGMTLVGLTGTNGKTTTSWMIEQIVASGGGRAGVIGTVNYRYQRMDGERVEQDAPLTTPEPMILQGLLKEMNEAGVTHVILEVSSHSLAQQRLSGLLFDVAVFTNLSRDHLDYHANMEAYFSAKKKLFEEYLQPGGIAVVVTDGNLTGNKKKEDWGRKLVERLHAEGFKPFSVKGENRAYLTCGFANDCMVRADGIKQDIEGIVCRVLYTGEEMRMQSELIGRHNISNMLAATAAGIALEGDFGQTVQAVQQVSRVPGRLERIRRFSGPEGLASGPQVFIDYAHTPDALKNVLQTLRPVTRGRLFCVFGCGGDRDKGKRPMMGSVAAGIADALLITSDNPRSEEPAAILAEIERGLAGSDLRKVDLDTLFDPAKPRKGYAVLVDRRQAIHHACGRAGKDDVILIAGKGHETYQITAGEKRFFDDRIEARNGRLRWSNTHLVAATAGDLIQPGETVLYGRISTDTRTLWAGDVFVALSGERYDGHEFVNYAVKQGAAAVIVERRCRGLGKEAAVIRVEDTLKALGDLAHYRRQLLGPDVTVIGITGSSGKTTVKEMTASIFEAAFIRFPGQPVLKTQGNLNNLIGLPLSLLNIDGRHRVAVLEMGMNRPGEIQRLTRIAKPVIGCITNVQAAHLEGLGSIKGVALAKGELFVELPERGMRVVNCDDPHIWKLGGCHGNNCIGFAVTPKGRRRRPAVRATRIVSLAERGMRFTLHIDGWRRRITVPANGYHNVANCTAAAAIATAAGVKPGAVVRGLASYRSGDKRLQIVDLPGGIKVVNDAYNANPASMAAALQTVSQFGGECRRVALLGDMFELGGGATEAHKSVGSLVAELGFDYLGVTGKFAAAVTRMAEQSGMHSSRIRRCDNKQDMAAWVAGLVAEKKIGRDDWLLIKGSRGMSMEDVLQFLSHKLQTVLT